MFAYPECRKMSVSVLRKMDNCAVNAINAAKAFASTPETPAQLRGFGLEHALDLKRLMTKYKDEYSGFAEDGYDYHGYAPFSKALPLIN